MIAQSDERTVRAPAAFTIIELLIIIAVIALLLALLAPSVVHTLDFTQMTICQSNLHGIGIGMQHYVANFRHYPGHCSKLRHTFPYAVWPPRTRRYASKDRQIYFCPNRENAYEWPLLYGSGGEYADQADAAEWFYEVGERMLNVHTTPFSYAYNDWGNHRAGPTDGQRGLGGDMRSMVAVDELPMTAVAAPSDMIAIGDGQQTGSWDFNLDPGDRWEWPSRNHSGGANIVFCDGHVEWALQSYWTNVDTSTEEGRKVAKRWNNHNKWTND